VIFRRGILQLFGFSLSGLLSLAIDMGLFVLFVPVLAGLPFGDDIRVAGAQTLARAVSAVCNYLMNRNLVFAAKGGLFDRNSFFKYAALCVVVLLASVALVWLGRVMIPAARDPGSPGLLIVKLTADMICFFLSFFVQKLKIFSQSE